jgi:hypothetical protein
MPYTQKWGISRNAFQSPLHDNGEEDNPATNIIKENNEKEEKVRTIMDPNYKSEGDKIREKMEEDELVADENAPSVQSLETFDSKPQVDNPFHEGFYLTPTKQAAKQIIKKTVPKTIIGNMAKFLGGTAMTTIGTFLGSQKAYAPNPTTFNFEEEFAQEYYAKEREGMTKSEIDEFNKINYLKSLPQSKSKHTLIQG